MIGQIVLGLLGWSNKRSGVEFYRWDDKIIPRHGSEWGELLAEQDGIAGEEGCPVIVVRLPRRTSPDDAKAIRLLVESALVGKVLAPTDEATP